MRLDRPVAWDENPDTDIGRAGLLAGRPAFFIALVESPKRVSAGVRWGII